MASCANPDLSKLPYGRAYLIPVVTSTVALLFMLVSAYSCKFVKVTFQAGGGDDASPFFFGVWKAEGGVAAGQGFLANTNECISWTDTSMYDDGGVRAAKIFSIAATLLGTSVWVLIVMGLCQTLNQILRIILVAGAGGCAILALMFFCVFASDVCGVDGVKCRWGAASYISLTATALWAVTASVSYLLTQNKREDGDGSNMGRDLVTVGTTHSTPTVPTGTTARTLHHRPKSYPQESYSEGNRTLDSVQEQARSSPVDLDDEVGMDDMPPIGSPLISITEDEHGNLVKTTITRTKDSLGRTIIDRTSQVIEDNDKAETASV